MSSRVGCTSMPSVTARRGTKCSNSPCAAPQRLPNYRSPPNLRRRTVVRQAVGSAHQDRNHETRLLAERTEVPGRERLLPTQADGLHVGEEVLEGVTPAGAEADHGASVLVQPG